MRPPAELRERLRRHSRDNRFILGGLAVLLILFAALYYLIQRSRDLPPGVASDKVLLFVLSAIDVVLILVILFVLLRDLLKLLVERHHRILGSKLKIKLLATFIGLSLLPVLLLFFYGSQLLNGWIDRWFNEPAMRRVLEEGSLVAQELNRRLEEQQVRDARRILREIADLDLADPRRRPDLTRRLQVLREEMALDLVAVHEGSELVLAVLNPLSGLRDLPELRRRFLLEALDRGQAVQIGTPAGASGRLVVTAVAGARREGRPQPMVAAGTLLGPEVAGQTERLIEAFQGYRQLELQQGEIESGYRLTFLTVTLLILLAFTWVGLYLARRVTLPIQALATGTQRISGGDLSYRVAVPADDELAVLVDSFNRMTAELQRNKEDLVAANLRLQEERALVAAILDNLAAGVVAVDREGRILTCNGAALQMLRQDEGEVLGRGLREAWPDGERGKLATLLEEAASLPGRTTRQLRLVLGGEWRTFEAKVTGMRDPRGERSGQVMVLEDLTQLIKAQHLAAWGEAARRVAHEIKNPLTPIRLSAERLRHKLRQGDPDLDQAIEEAVEIIGREVTSMKGMVDEFSRFARMPPPQLREVDVSGLLAETLQLYEGLKPGVEVAGEVDGSVGAAWLDAEQVRRVLINLLDNALEATEAPGRVSVAVQRSNGRLQIDVADSGRGIPPEAREKLFLPHFSTKGRGTGLGLAIVHRIVADHHGSIRVRDNEPTGTVFTIELPGT